MEYRQLIKIARNMQLYESRLKLNDDLNQNELEMIRYLTKHPGISFTEMSEYLGVDKALVTRMSKKLENNGILKIDNDVLDARKKLLFPNESAYKIKEKMIDNENEFIIKAIGVLDEQEKEMFFKLIEKVYLESKRLRKNNFKDFNHE